MRRALPNNSRGRPWAPGDTWTCTACGEVGDDRDDVVLSACRAVASPNGPHASIYTTAGETWPGSVLRLAGGAA